MKEINTVDKKVLDYLKRARVIEDKCFIHNQTDRLPSMRERIVEIAKMIQLEEHHIELQEYGRNINSKNEY